MIERAIGRRGMAVEQRYWKQAMHTTNPIAMSQNVVTALFADRTLSFNLSKEATFEDLANRLDQLNEWHMGTPTAINLKFTTVQH